MLINRDTEKICGDLEDSYFGYHRGNQPAPKKLCIYCRRYLLSHNEITPQIITAAMFKETSQIFSLTKRNQQSDKLVKICYSLVVLASLRL